MANRGQFQKGISGNLNGRPKRADTMVIFDLREAARKHCPKAIEVVAKCMDHKDPRVRLTAAALMLERGYGKPELKTDVTAMHAFAVVPQVMTQEEWLRTRGQPQLLSPDAPTTLDLKPAEPEDKLN